MVDRIDAFERDGLVFDVVDGGPLDGEIVVLLHGFPERATCWREVTPILHEAGYRTLAPDQRGYSPGARPRRRRDYRVTELVGDVIALLDRAGSSDVHLVGHDYGAMVAWSTAILHPERVRTLTAVSVAHPGAFLKSWLRSSQLVSSWYMAFFQLPWVPERVLGMSLGSPLLRGFGMGEEAVERFQSEMVDDDALRGGLHWYRAMPFLDPRLPRRRVSTPTTLVWSTEDAALGRWAPEHCEEYVDGPFQLVVLDGVSHWIPTEAPAVLADAILNRVRG